MTTYAEVGADRDVAAFLAAHLDAINIFRLPVKMWAARDEHGIVAVLTLKTDPYPSLDFILADPASRPFMRIYKLYRIAEAWLRAHSVPIIAASVHNSHAHYQSLLRRFGFERIGEESDANGNVVETIYSRRLDRV